VRARLITLITLAGGAPVAGTRLPAVDHAAERSLFAAEIRPGWSEFLDSRWRPRFHDVRDWEPAGYGAPNAGSAYRVLRCRTAVVTVPAAARLLLLDVDLDADAPGGLILAEKDAFDPAVHIGLNGLDLVDASGLPGARLSGSRRQVLVLDGAEPDSYLLGRHPGQLSAERERVLRQLMFKDVDIEYRPELAPVRVPIDMNGPDLQAVFVWDSNTVAEGLASYPHLADLRVFGMAMSNAQVLAAQARCQEIREEAVRESDRAADPARSTVDIRRAGVSGRVRRVAALQQDLTMGVEMYALGTNVAGGRPLLRYHEAVVAESPLPHLLTVTQHLLGQVVEAVRAEQRLLEVDEAREAADKQLAIAASTRGLLDQSEAFKAASLVFAAVVAVISLAGLFAAAAAIPREQRETMFGSTRGSVLFVLVAVVAAVAFGVALRRVSRVRLALRGRRMVRAARWVALGLLVAGLLLAFVPAAALAGLVAVGLASVGALFSLALELDFEPPDAPQGSAAVVEIWPLSVHDTTVYRWATAPVRMPLDRPEYDERRLADPARVPAHGVERLVAMRVARLCGREPRYLHSTSWRLSDSVVTLTYVAIVDTPPGDPTRWVPVEPGAPSPGAVGEADVLHHALGHLAFLAAYRPVDAELFADGWAEAFGSWTPVPAGQLNDKETSG
jgi:hypothetical protein